MLFLLDFVNIFIANFWKTIISLFVSYVLYKLSIFYMKVWSLPPGPFPLPLIGNILLFRGGKHFTDTFRKLTEKYGPVFTFWMGNKPYIFITDLKIAKDTFRQVDFSGRADGFFKKWHSNDIHHNISMSEDPTHEVLRAITSSAVNKYRKSEDFINCLNDCVETTVNEMIHLEGVNKQFCPNEYIHGMFFKFIYMATFGRDFTTEDETFKKAKSYVTDFAEDLGSKMPRWQLSPIIRLLERNTIQRYTEKVFANLNAIKDLFKSHEKAYNESNDRNICDAVITARNTALREGKPSSQYLNDNNLSLCMADVFTGGSDTSGNIFIWGLLFMTYYPEIQQKLRQEIESQIGDRIPTLEDKEHCHYVMAFISETLRIRNALPIGLPHKTTAECKIVDYLIPKDSNVVVINQLISTDDKNWSNGQHFKPERFLENQNYTTKGLEANIPFGVGRRLCLGDKFAMANLFFALVRFLQLTMDYDLVLGTNKGIEPDPNQAIILMAHRFKLIFKKR